MAGFGPGDAFSEMCDIKKAPCAFSFDIYPLTKARRFYSLIGMISENSSQPTCSFA